VDSKSRYLLPFSIDMIRTVVVLLVSNTISAVVFGDDPFESRIHCNHPLSRTFLALSTSLFTSAAPFSTTFSICVPAFFRSSGREVLLTCSARSFLCCLPLASRTLVLALSPAFVASWTAPRRESAVGGGMLTTRRSGLAPVGSG